MRKPIAGEIWELMNNDIYLLLDKRRDFAYDDVDYLDAIAIEPKVSPHGPAVYQWDENGIYKTHIIPEFNLKRCVGSIFIPGVEDDWSDE